MTPVINPWVFYLMPVCENMSILAFILTLMLGFAIVFLGIGCMANMDYGYDDTVEKFLGVIKKIIPFFVIAVLLTCLIPTEETLTKIIVAQNVTVERVDMVSDTVVTVYNDIMNLFKDAGAANG